MRRLITLAMFVLTACGGSPQPRPDVDPPVWTVTIVALDGCCTRLDGARVLLGERETIASTFGDEHGVARFEDVPSGEYELRVIAEGFHETAGPLEVDGHVNMDIVLRRANVVARRRGIVRADGGVFVDDDGRYLAGGATFLWALWGYRHDRDRLERNLAFLAERGVQYIRVLGEVGPGGGWEDRQIDSRWPDYDATIAGLTDLAYDTYGLRVEWTLFGGVDHVPSPEAREAVARRFVAMATAGRQHKIQHFEVVNEGYQNGFGSESGRAEARRLAGILRESGNLVAITAAGGVEAPLWYSDTAANLITLHFGRSPDAAAGLWQPVRQAWEAQFLSGVPRTWTSNEPIGPQSTVASDDDPLRLTMSAALTWLAGGAGYVLHTGAGVRGGGSGDVALGRAANFWDVPNIDATLQGMRAVRAALSDNLPNWERLNAGDGALVRGRYPFDIEPLIAAQSRDALLRAFGARDGNAFVVMPIRIAGEVPFVAQEPMTVEVLQPLTGGVLRTAHLRQGDTLTLSPADGAAVIIRGRFTEGDL